MCENSELTHELTKVAKAKSSVVLVTYSHLPPPPLAVLQRSLTWKLFCHKFFDAILRAIAIRNPCYASASCHDSFAY
jgi:hypothetical protein